MAVLQTDIDALRDALTGGERVVQLDGKRVEYRSVDEIERALNRLLRDKAADDAAASGKYRPRMARLMHGGRGY